jgi:hypothetical protein
MIRKTTTTLILGSLICAGAAVAETAVTATPPVRIDLDVVVNTGMPLFAGGRVIFFHLARAASDPHMSSYTLDGRLQARFRLDLPDAFETYPNTFSRSRDGYIGFAVGTSGSQRLSRLCFLDEHGKIRRQVKVSPFVPYLSAIAPDEFIWAFGPTGGPRSVVLSAPLLRRFTPDGEPAGEWVPAKQFPEDPPPAEEGNGIGQSFLKIAGSRVVLYMGSAMKLFEFTTCGQEIGAYDLKLPPKTIIKGLAITSSGDVFASLSGPGQTGLYELDRKAAAWVRHELPRDMLHLRIAGADGDDLVMDTMEGFRSYLFQRVSVEPKYSPAAP